MNMTVIQYSVCRIRSIADEEHANARDYNNDGSDRQKKTVFPIVRIDIKHPNFHNFRSTPDVVGCVWTVVDMPYLNYAVFEHAG
jgi:hypothetical protein